MAPAMGWLMRWRWPLQWQWKYPKQRTDGPCDGDGSCTNLGVDQDLLSCASMETIELLHQFQTIETPPQIALHYYILGVDQDLLSRAIT